MSDDAKTIVYQPDRVEIYAFKSARMQLVRIEGDSAIIKFEGNDPIKLTENMWIDIRLALKADIETRGK